MIYHQQSNRSNCSVEYSLLLNADWPSPPHSSVVLPSMNTLAISDFKSTNPASPFIPFPSSPTISSGSKHLPPSRRKSASSVLSTASDTSSTSNNSTEFHTTFSNVFDSVRRMRIHIRAFDSSALLSTSYDFETNLLSLLHQITQVADQCAALSAYDTEYEASYSNLRFTLRAFMEAAESRALNYASTRLTFVVDAMYTFMELCIAEFSKWTAPHRRSDSVEIRRDHTMFHAPPTPVPDENPLESPQHLGEPSGSHLKPSPLKRLRTLSNLIVPVTRSKYSCVSPSSINRMESHLRASIDQTRNMMADLENCADQRPVPSRPPATKDPATGISLQGRFSRALRSKSTFIRGKDIDKRVVQKEENKRLTWPFPKSSTLPRRFGRGRRQSTPQLHSFLHVQ